MDEYNFKKIERKWQEKWNDQSFMENGYSKRGKKYYSLTMFSYPSGSNLHIGHWYNYGPADTFSRFKRTLSQLLNCFCLYILRFW